MLDQSKLQIMDHLADPIQNLFGCPYRTMVLYCSPAYCKNTLVKEIAKQHNLRYVDFLEEVLMSLDPISIETYDRNKLIEYMRKTLADNSTGVIFDELEGLFAIWSTHDIYMFFNGLHHFKVKYPVIVVTSQAVDFAKIQFEPDRFFKLD